MERITGVPFETALVRHVLGPLGVQHACFGPPGRVWGHRSRLPLGLLGLAGIGRGSAVDPCDPAADNPAVLGPAGRRSLTLGDWARVLRAPARLAAEALTTIPTTRR